MLSNDEFVFHDLVFFSFRTITKNSLWFSTLICCRIVVDFSHWRIFFQIIESIINIRWHWFEHFDNVWMHATWQWRWLNQHRTRPNWCNIDRTWFSGHVIIRICNVIHCVIQTTEWHIQPSVCSLFFFHPRKKQQQPTECNCEVRCLLDAINSTYCILQFLEQIAISVCVCMCAYFFFLLFVCRKQTFPLWLYQSTKTSNSWLKCAISLKC